MQARPGPDTVADKLGLLMLLLMNSLIEARLPEVLNAGGSTKGDSQSHEEVWFRSTWS